MHRHTPATHIQGYAEPERRHDACEAFGALLARARLPCSTLWAEPIEERFAKVGTYEIYRVVCNLVNGLPPQYRDDPASATSVDSQRPSSGRVPAVPVRQDRALRAYRAARVSARFSWAVACVSNDVSRRYVLCSYPLPNELF